MMPYSSSQCVSAYVQEVTVRFLEHWTMVPKIYVL